MTTEHEATRTLVKSPPELWAECSDAASLARHLGEFGEIKITRLDPETAVAWEGERVSGTVRIEHSAWGTRVTLTAHMTVDDVEDPVLEEVVEVAGEQTVESGQAVAADNTVVVDEPGGVEEPVVVKDAPPVAEEPVAEERVAEEPVAALEVGAAKPPIAPTRKPGLRARIRAYFERAGATKARTVTESPGVARSSDPHPVAVEPVAADGGSAEPEQDPGIPPAVADTETEPESVPAPAEPVPEPALQGRAPEPSRQEPEPTSPPPQLNPEAVLTAALESLGQAHHRPFSRA